MNGVEFSAAAVSAAALLAGCLSSAPEDPKAWLIPADTSLVVSSVTVASPYDGTRFVLLREDGSVAFDGFNVFAARPAALLRTEVREKYKAPRLIVRRLALDCRGENRREALAELALESDGEELARAEASVPTADGDYSKAFAEAVRSAAEKLVPPEAESRVR